MKCLKKGIFVRNKFLSQKQITKEEKLSLTDTNLCQKKTNYVTEISLCHRNKCLSEKNFCQRKKLCSEIKFLSQKLVSVRATHFCHKKKSFC